MTKYTVRVDASFYNPPNTKNTIAAAYEITNDTEGKVVKRDTWGISTDSISHSEHAELHGIHRAVFAMSKLDTESPVVVYVYCDCDKAIENLQEQKTTFGPEQEILDLTDYYHTVKWNAVSRDKMYDLDADAARERNRTRTT